MIINNEKKMKLDVFNLMIISFNKEEGLNGICIIIIIVI
jgi:hypothetical protein